jgi:hypothetical protein
MTISPGIVPVVPRAPSQRLQNEVMFGQLDLREVRIGEMSYPIAAFLLGGRHTAAWRCDVCVDRHSDGICEGKSAADAVMSAEAAVLAHHAAFHRDV